MMVRYNWDKPDELAGFECLGLSLLIFLMAEPGVGAQT
jgi:hypothetical protein